MKQFQSLLINTLLELYLSSNNAIIILISPKYNIKAMMYTGNKTKPWDCAFSVSCYLKNVFSCGAASSSQCKPEIQKYNLHSF